MQAGERITTVDGINTTWLCLFSGEILSRGGLVQENQYREGWGRYEDSGRGGSVLWKLSAVRDNIVTGGIVSKGIMSEEKNLVKCVWDYHARGIFPRNYV